MNISAALLVVKDVLQRFGLNKISALPTHGTRYTNQSLTINTLLNMVLRLALVILVISGISYWHLMSQLANDTQTQLLRYINERGQREESTFILAQDNHVLLRDEFLSQFNAQSDKDLQLFQKRFFNWSDGTTRNVPEGMPSEDFDTSHDPTSFVQPGVELTTDFQKRLLLSERLVKQYGAGWRDRFLDTYISLPEGANTVLWPGVAWGIDAKPDLYIPDEEWAYLGDNAHNSERQTLWTGVYADPVSQDWMVSAETPIDDTNGHHLATIGHDIVLTTLIERVLDDHLDGTYSLLIRADGQLIVEPHLMEKIRNPERTLNVRTMGDPHLEKILELARQTTSGGSNVVYNRADREYLAIAQLKGPEWYLITVYPEKLLQAQALGNTWFLLGLGLASLIMEVLLLWIVLQQKIKAPLEAILEATQQITDGGFSVNLDTKRQDELGQLAMSFIQMTNQLQKAFTDLEKKVMELEKTQAASHLLASVVESSNDAIITKTLQGWITSWNATAEKLFGYSEAEAIGQNILMLYPHDRVDEEPRIINRLKQGEQIEHFETMRLHKDKTPIAVSITISPVRDSNGKIVGASQIARDIRDRKRNQEAIIKKSQELETALEELKEAQLRIVQSEKMSALGNLVAGVAHEINNPVGCILGNVGATQEYMNDLLGLLNLYAKRLPEPGPDIENKLKAVDLEYVRTDLPKLIRAMKDSGDRIRSISKSLRTFSRADKKTKQAFNLHDGIDSTVLILRHRLKANDQRPAIEVITDYGDIPEVKCFPGQLNQVFMNILANAIDALDEANQNRSFDDIKSHPHRITIHTSMDNQQVKIAIADNGPGIPEETKAKIFDHLFTTKQVGKGTGLGLAIAHQIVVDTHGGALSVQSEIGQGTEFYICLPL